MRVTPTADVVASFVERTRPSPAPLVAAAPHVAPAAKGPCHLAGRVTATELAAALAAVVEAVAPPGVVMTARDGTVRYTAPWGSGEASLTTLLDAFDDRPEDAAALACQACLQRFEGGFSQPTRPWPTQLLPVAHAETRGGFIHLWFGDADDPVLELQPIRW